MAVETLLRVSASNSLRGEEKPLLSLEASREGRVVVRLSGLESEGNVRVSAEIYPIVGLKTHDEPTGFLHDFPTLNQARQFVDEMLIALEYLGCTVTDMNAEKQ